MKFSDQDIGARLGVAFASVLLLLILVTGPGISQLQAFGVVTRSLATNPADEKFVMASSAATSERGAALHGSRNSCWSIPRPGPCSPPSRTSAGCSWWLGMPRGRKSPRAVRKHLGHLRVGCDLLVDADQFVARVHDGCAVDGQIEPARRRSRGTPTG